MQMQSIMTQALASPRGEQRGATGITGERQRGATTAIQALVQAIDLH